MSVTAWLQRERLRTLAFITAGITLAAMAFQLMGAHDLVLANGQPVFGDYLAFWSAGRLALEHHPELIYSKEAIEVAHREALPALQGIVFPWRHPPTFLVIATPLSILEYPYSAIIFFIATATFYLYAARKLAMRDEDLIFAAAMPAALLHVGSVQVGLLIGGMTALALYWQERRPIAAGMMIGLLAIKPHLAILWPLYLIVQKRWTTFFVAAATLIAFCIFAGALFGFDLFPAFIASLAEGKDSVSSGFIEKDTLTSLYANLLGLGFPDALAMGVHILSAAAATAVAVLIWRRGDPALSAAAFACATMLFSPYLFFYDEVLLLIAIAMLYRGARPREAAWLAFAWAAAALSLATGKLLTIPICTIAAWALLLISAQRAGIRLRGIAGSRPAPEPRT